jgi:hypothetical protein
MPSKKKAKASRRAPKKNKASRAKAKKSTASRTAKAAARPMPLAPPMKNPPDLPHRAGLPAKDSIISITEPLPRTGAVGLTAAPRYRIIHTNEVDEYEKAATSPAHFAAAVAAAAPSGDNYNGTARKAAKLSIATAPTEDFNDVKDLIATLPAEAKMTKHTPKITTAATSNRVQEEKRNVRLKVFIYAASKEADNDFHLIMGRDPSATPEVYMTMELSGLPPSKFPAFPQLKAARDAFEKFFNDNLGGKLPGPGYDFPDPPIPVEIEGSLFFDMTHATSGGPRPGPKSLKSRMPVIWEVHPISKMVFEP